MINRLIQSMTPEVQRSSVLMTKFLKNRWKADNSLTYLRLLRTIFINLRPTELIQIKTFIYLK